MTSYGICQPAFNRLSVAKRRALYNRRSIKRAQTSFQPAPLLGRPENINPKASIAIAPTIAPGMTWIAITFGILGSFKLPLAATIVIISVCRSQRLKAPATRPTRLCPKDPN
jgi:hypothetical protein